MSRLLLEVQMPLEAGRSLDHYRLVQPLGEGGMGVVWRAHDTTLGRDVAIKVLPDFFATNPERLARFEREARLLASLNHPHIGAIYGLHAALGLRFLALELVDGANLAERLARSGPLPVDETVRIALQIAQALEHAHEKGIVHRDLKPGNVMLTSDGQVKVLDFGLAKAFSGEPSEPGQPPSISQSPTLTGYTSSMAVLIGTAAYMSPEQARGQPADRRADVWAFGVVLLEMLTGRRTFEGETVSDTLASVLKTDPEWSRLPAGLPRRVRDLLRRCLERNPQRRLRDIGEARVLLEDVLASPHEEVQAVPSAVRPSRRVALAVGLAGLAVGAVAVWFAKPSGPRAPEMPHRKFRVTAKSPDAVPEQPVLSPDGKKLAYLTGEQLWVQDLAELEPREIRVEQGAQQPFWAPDGAALGYFVGTRIYKVMLGSGESQVVSDTRAPFTGGTGGHWLDDGTIVFSRGDSAGILQVSSRGGDPKPLFGVRTAEETDFHTPHALPGGRGILFTVHHKETGVDQLDVWAGAERKELVQLEGQSLSSPLYSSTGHILFQRSPTTPGIWALPFSLERLEATGDPFLVAPGGRAPSLAADGTLAYMGSETAGVTRLAWVDRAGAEVRAVGGARVTGSLYVAASPDGRRVARTEGESDNNDVWIHDPERDTRTRLTFSSADEDCPCWSPDGERIVYHTSPHGCSGARCFTIVSQLADGTGAADTLGTGAVPRWSPDGRHIVWTGFESNGARWNIVALDRGSGRPPQVVVRGNARACAGVVSPDGKLLAYMSFESGQWEVYLARFPTGEGRWQVSSRGGQWPRWHESGGRLYFVHGDDMMEVEVAGGGAPVLGAPRKLFAREPIGPWSFAFVPSFDVAPDGSRFLVVKPAGERSKSPGVTVVQNWFAEFRSQARQ
jgi:serine/threonine protein kinase